MMLQCFFLSFLIVKAYSDCVFLALCIQHVMRMPRIVICSLSGSTVFFQTIS